MAGDGFNNGREQLGQFGIRLQLPHCIASGFDQRLDVDAPTSQLGGQAGVLPIAANRQAQLVFLHYNGSRAARIRPLGEKHPIDACRADGLGNINYRIGIPLDNVDFLVVQFLDDGLNTDAFDAHTSAHGVNAGLGSHNGHFGALSRLAGNGADLDDAMIDLRNFILQQTAQEVAM